MSRQRGREVGRHHADSLLETKLFDHLVTRWQHHASLRRTMQMPDRTFESESLSRPNMATPFSTRGERFVIVIL